MATIPNVQSNIQTIAQANTPFLANNGNPGTVYNMPNTGSYKAPMSSAMNQWALNPTGGSIYANNPFWLGGGAPVGPGGGSPFTVTPGSVLPPSIVIPGTTTPPVTTVTPPVIGPNAGVGGTNTGGGGAVVNYGGGVSNIGTSGSNFTHTVGGGGSLGNIANALGGSNISWQEVLDAFLPGDLYDAGSGTWDISNAVAEGLNYVIPFLGDAAQWATNNGYLGQTLQDMAFDESYKQFEARQANNVAESSARTQSVMDTRVAETAARRLKERMNQFTPNGAGWNPSFNSGFGMGAINPITGAVNNLGSSPFDGNSNQAGSTINDRMNNWGIGGTTGRDSRSGNSARSGVVAEGAGAQDMVAGMQLEQFLNGTSAQAKNAMDKMFKGKER